MQTKSAATNASTALGRQLGDELRRLREKVGPTTNQVAEALDCIKGKISRIENGRVQCDSLAVLLQQVGGAQVMNAQLQHLLASSEHPIVTVQVLPFSRGAHASMFGPYVVLGFPEEGALDVVPADNPSGSMWLEREADVSRYQDLFDAARTSALSQAESRAVIHRRAEEHQA
ncbi:helix-turn-helix domain-containing protein [Streptomyces griseus]|uniref:helix-turn-helix domain-containing protein n=1 Tax=Streptomyces griseus TaxID=1911 RepID=UPI003673CD66